ncbi:(2Fe-2S)-binding protein [Acuticoccus sediminis]|uniref:(2Fe-2S)-binding protein n=1 Tax=Acuticoccus sediminis TaxID=2184697 RepID=A0A8B2NRQ1_9HYPH|nr:Rieske 2Fe-2S domain-containing protein [Acuticoccus sediminis]RAI00739.1 (2Fe-2S)-binding protein [Acuticoccus sediminis]
MTCDNSYIVCSIDDIPNRRAVGLVLARIDEATGGEVPYPVVLVRWGRRVVGYVNRCPHAGTRLDWEEGQFLDTTGERLICGKHGSTFALADGACASGPATGSALERVKVEVIDGDVVVGGVRLAVAE